MDITKAFPSKFISAEDLQGQTVELTIASVSLEDVGDSDVKPVLRFLGARKGLVLNKTNAMAVASVYGNETDEWISLPIVLFPTTTEFRGNTVPCIRIRVDEPAIVPNVAAKGTKRTKRNQKPAARPQPVIEEQLDDEPVAELTGAGALPVGGNGGSLNL